MNKLRAEVYLLLDENKDSTQIKNNLNYLSSGIFFAESIEDLNEFKNKINDLLGGNE